MLKVIEGTIKNNSNEDYVKYLEGIRVVCLTWPKDYYSICGGANEENQEKYKRVLFEQLGREEGIKTFEEFKKIYAESDDFGAGIKPQNLIDIKELTEDIESEGEE